MADMQTAIATPGTAGSSPSGAPLGALAALTQGLGSKLWLVAGMVALAATLAASVLMSRSPDYKVLFANLSDRDGGTVLATLSQMNIPYKFAEGGSAILVPADQVHAVRLKLASQGIPKGGTVGFELMETQKFGVTQFQERLNFQRGLEGELARSIMSLAAVQNARVHLALPNQSGFLRDQLKPSASVLITLHPARSLDRQQVSGIVHLVAASVPDLTPKQVSVVDQNGSLLAPTDGQTQQGLDPSQLGYVRQLESTMVQRVVDLLEPVVGRGNVRVQVSADIDFTQVESTAEEFRPNQGKDANGKDVLATVRSQQTSENIARDAGAATPAQGIPGALSNQPPGASTAPINGPAQATQAAAPNAAGGANGLGANQKRDSVTNFEVDKTVRVTRNASGQVRRLTAAVVINHRKVVDAKGKATQTPLADKELESITALVKEALGMSKDRGDSLNVLNTAFTPDETPATASVPVWKDPDMLALAGSIGRHVGVVLLGLLILFLVVRPAMKQINAQTPKPALVNQAINNEVGLPPPGNTAPAGLSNAEVLRLAREDPAMVANVVRTWVNKDG
jgi:flagellar M-ring protein FliF